MESSLIINALISGADVALSLVFTILVFRQLIARRKTYQLMWTIALALWTIAVTAELAATLLGWSAFTYRAYYAAGALLVSAWLGMGSLYLILRKVWADRILGTLSILSLIGIMLIIGWPIADAQLLTHGEFLPLRVFPFFPIQLLLIVLNIFGTLAFAGGALYSAYKFAHTRAMVERAIATALIGIGGAIAATAHSLGVFAGIELFRISELLALVVILVGFLLSSPSSKPNRATTTNSAA